MGYFAGAVSYIKLDMDINSMMSCKGLSEVMSFSFKVLFSSHLQGQIVQFWL
jgi:hypothetical protein